MSKETIKKKKVANKPKSSNDNLEKIAHNSEKILELYKSTVELTSSLNRLKEDVKRIKIRMGLWV